MTYTVRMFTFEPDEQGNLPSWELGNPRQVFQTAEEANHAGIAEVIRMSSKDNNATFLVLDTEGRFVENYGIKAEPQIPEASS